ncbi:AMP-binding protein [Streptomyces sp. NPDC054786]
MTAQQNSSSLVHSLLDEAAAERPESPAIRDAIGVWSYRELFGWSHAYARWLRAKGVTAGQRVVAQLPSTRELVALFFAASRIGAIFVPLNPAMKNYHLASVFDNADPVLAITTPAAVPAVASLADVPVHDFETVRAQVAALANDPVEPAPVRPDDVAVLVYTSGSTAAPKAVICPHAQMTFASRAINAELRYGPDDVVFCRFPISWDYGLYKILLCCLGRSEIVLAGEESDLVLLRRMRETGTTVVPLVPSLAGMIVKLARRDPEPAPPVRLFTNTGAALAATTITALRELFPGTRVVRQYGQTESKRISIMPPEQDTERPDSVGRPLPGTTVQILDADGNELPVGQIGEIVVSGPHVMPGYWQAPELTERTFRMDQRTGQRRLHTGDYGSLDEDGYLYFDGRRDDMFKRKGIRMSTLEIEAAAMDIAEVRTAAVLPPSDKHDLALFVEGDLAPHVVLKELAQRLEPAKVPAVCRVLTDLPLTLHGKNSRQVLAEMLDEGDTP